jgi:hypothetical protein
LGCWISACYGPYSRGGRFEIYEPFSSLIFQFLSGRGEARITETADNDSRDTGVRLYLNHFKSTGSLKALKIRLKYEQKYLGVAVTVNVSTNIRAIGD